MEIEVEVVETISKLHSSFSMTNKTVQITKHNNKDITRFFLFLFLFFFFLFFFLSGLQQNKQKEK